MPKASHLRAIPVAQMYKAIHGQKASSELISLIDYDYPAPLKLRRAGEHEHEHERMVP